MPYRFDEQINNGGKSWNVFRAGLSQKNSYDVTFHHVLDKHRCLEHDFPPVYSICFAGHV